MGRCFLAESIKIVNTAFPYKNTLSEANVKTNRMRSPKKRSFVSNYFINLKILFYFKNLLQRIDLMY